MPTHDMQYTTPARLFHWIMAVLILLTIPAGLIMIQEGISRELQNALFIYHKNVGVLLLLLVVLRLIWRVRNPAPPLPSHVPSWQARIAGLSHFLLYALLFLMPIAGYVRVKAGGFPIEGLDAMGVPSLVAKSDAVAETAKTIHYFGALTIIAVLSLHIGAALLHGVVRRDGVFSRMWPPMRPDAP